MKTIKVSVNGQDMGTFQVTSVEYARQQWTAMHGDNVKIEVCD